MVTPRPRAAQHERSAVVVHGERRAPRESRADHEVRRHGARQFASSLLDEVREQDRPVGRALERTAERIEVQREDSPRAVAVLREEHQVPGGDERRSREAHFRIGAPHETFERRPFEQRLTAFSQERSNEILARAVETTGPDHEAPSRAAARRFVADPHVRRGWIRCEDGFVDELEPAREDRVLGSVESQRAERLVLEPRGDPDDARRPDAEERCVVDREGVRIEPDFDWTAIRRQFQRDSLSRAGLQGDRAAGADLATGFIEHTELGRARDGGEARYRDEHALAPLAIDATDRARGARDGPVVERLADGVDLDSYGRVLGRVTIRDGHHATLASELKAQRECRREVVARGSGAPRTQRGQCFLGKCRRSSDRSRSRPARHEGHARTARQSSDAGSDDIYGVLTSAAAVAAARFHGSRAVQCDDEVLAARTDAAARAGQEEREQDRGQDLAHERRRRAQSVALAT